MDTQCLGDPRELAGAPRPEPCKVAQDEPSQPWLLDVLKTDLEACHVLFDLLDEGQMLRQVCQTRIRLELGRIDRRRAGCDQNRIERVVLGTSQVYARIGSDLQWLQNQDREARRP